MNEADPDVDEAKRRALEDARREAEQERELWVQARRRRESRGEP